MRKRAREKTLHRARVDAALMDARECGLLPPLEPYKRKPERWEENTALVLGALALALVLGVPPILL